MKTKLSCLLALASVASLPVYANSVKLVSVGDKTFGGDITYTFTELIGAKKWTGEVMANADCYVLNAKLKVATGDVKMEIQDPSQCHATGYLKLAGATVAKFDKSFTGSVSFTTPPFFKAQAGGSAKFGVGPIGLKLKANAEAKAYVKGNVKVDRSSTTGRPIVHCDVGPVLDAAASGSVEADAKVVDLGVEAALKLTGYSLNGHFDFIPRTQGTPDLVYSLTADTQATDGYIKGFAKIDLWIAHKTFHKTFYEYHGGPTSTVLASGVHRL